MLVKIVLMMMAPGGTPVPSEVREREPPPSPSSLTSSLDGRRVSPLVLGLHGMGGARAPPRLDMSLYVSGSAFSSLALSPFRIYMEIHNSDWTETFAVIFYQKLAFLRLKKGINRLTGGPRGSGARPGAGAPPASWPPRASSRVDFSSGILQIFQKYSPSVFTPFGFRLIWIFCET